MKEAGQTFTLHPSLFTLLSKPHLVFALIATLAGVAYALITPPFQAPDEVGHFWRGASIGEGVIEATTARGSVAEVPKGIRDLVAATWIEPGNIHRHAFAYAEEMAGRLGWLNVPIPVPVIIGQLLILLLATAFSSTSLPRFVRLMAALAVASGVAAVFMAQYLIWTPVCSGSLDGVQGRYFLPLLPLAIAAAAGPLRVTRPVRAGVPVMSCIANVAGVAAIWARYH